MNKIMDDIMVKENNNYQEGTSENVTGPCISSNVYIKMDNERLIIWREINERLTIKFRTLGSNFDRL